MYDVIIRNGKIVDGTGKDFYISDIAIKGGIIEKIGKLDGEKAEKIINAEGKTITPGFIDMHSHGDATLLIYPEMQSKLMQGITTIVGGQCGLSPAPIDKNWLTQYYEMGILDEIEPFIYSPNEIYPIEKIKDLFKEKYNLDIDWKSFGDFLNKVEKSGISANFVPLVGHGQIRAQVMGNDFARTASEEEIKEMREYVKEAMDAGAYGMSVGLDYIPGVYSDFHELLEVSKELQSNKGLYAAHWRKTGLRVGTPKKQKKIDGIIETLEIGKQLGLQVQISHISTGFDVFPAKNDYMMRAVAKATLEVVDNYIEDGVNAAFDVIPNVAGGIIICPKLCSYFGPWIKQSGSIDQFIKNLKASDYRKQMIDMINSGKFYEMNPIDSPDWDEYIKVIKSTNKNYIDKTICEISKSKNKSSVDMIFELLVEDPEIVVFAITQRMSIETAKEFLKHPQATVCTDTFAFDLKGTWDESIGYLPAPNTYCGMVKYVKELGMERIEDTIRKATGKAAEILGFTDRGLIKEGYKADVLVIDMNNLKTNENYVDSRVYPEGIDYVLVNGKVVVDEGKHTGKLAGEVIRKKN